MESRTLICLNLVKSFSLLQDYVWSILPPVQMRAVNALSLRQVKTMMLVSLRDASGEAPFTLSDLCARLRIKKATASELVSDLVDKDFLTRTTDPENRRFIRLTLGKNGRRLISTVVSHVDARLNDVFAKLNASETEIFLRVAAQLHANIEKGIPA